MKIGHIEPPENYPKGKTLYFTMLAEMIGKKFINDDDYCVQANWILTKIIVDNPDNDCDRFYELTN